MFIAFCMIFLKIGFFIFDMLILAPTCSEAQNMVDYNNITFNWKEHNNKGFDSFI